jgi:hypothetical protein
LKTIAVGIDIALIIPMLIPILKAIVLFCAFFHPERDDHISGQGMTLIHRFPNTP